MSDNEVLMYIALIALVGAVFVTVGALNWLWQRRQRREFMRQFWRRR